MKDETKPRNLTISLGEERLRRAKTQPLDDMVEEELKTLILSAGDPKEKAQLLGVAVKFLAVKHRIGPIWGTELDAASSE